MVGHFLAAFTGNPAGRDQLFEGRHPVPDPIGIADMGRKICGIYHRRALGTSGTHPANNSRFGAQRSASWDSNRMSARNNRPRAAVLVFRKKTFDNHFEPIVSNGIVPRGRGQAMVHPYVCKSVRKRGCGRRDEE